MKKLLSILLAISIIFSSAYVGLSEVDFSSFFAVRAEAAGSGTCGSDLSWTLDNEGTLFISGSGKMENYDTSNVFLGSPFKGSTEIKKVIIGEGVTSIGNSAFYNCTNLVSVTLPNPLSVSYFESIGDNAFYGCTNLAAISMPLGVKAVGKNAFKNCSSLRSIVLPDSVEELGNGAFYGCTSLEAVTLSNGIGTLGQDIFYGCNSLHSVEIPQGISTIGSLDTLVYGGPFKNCKNLVSVALPDTVTKIYKESFEGCSNLAYVFYAGTQEQWDNIEFSGIAVNNVLKSAIIHYEANDHTYGEYIYDYSANTQTRECTVCGYALKEKISDIDLLTFTLDSAGKSYCVTGCDSSATGNVIIPSTYNGLPVTEIGQSAFVNCNKIETATIPDSIYRIGFYAFNGSSIKNITIPGSVEVIYQDAFSNCVHLESVVIEDGLKYIYGAAFVNCENLTEIKLPDSIISIFENEFTNTAYYNNPYNWDNGVLYVGNHLIKVHTPFKGSIIVKGGTKTIADKAFYNCSYVDGVSLPYGLNSIGTAAFYGCSQLQSVDIPEGLVMIGGEAFANCENLSSVTIGDGATFIWNNTFNNTAYYNNPINWEDGVLYVDNYLITAKNDLLGNYVIKPGTKVIACQAFLNCTVLEGVDIPDSVISIGHDAFYNTALYNTTTNWDNGVLYIDNCLIDAKDSLSGEYIVKTGTRLIASAAFYLSNITSIVFSTETEHIGWFAFEYSTLEKISLYNTIKNIDYRAFFYCFNIDDVEFYGTEEEWKNIQIKEGNIPLKISNISYKPIEECEHTYGDYVYDYTANTKTKVCSVCGYALTEKFEVAGSLTFTLSQDGTYYIVSDCDTYAEGAINIPSVYNGLPVRVIGDGAFYGCQKITSFTIPDSITSIEKNAFYGCYGITDIAIPDSVKSLGDGAFSMCLYLTSVEIPDSVTSIGESAFYSCYALQSVTIPNTITSIGKNAFYACYDLQSVIIPDSITSISDGTFSMCWNMTSVTIPKSVKSIGNSAFYDCRNLSDVYYSGSEAEWAEITIEENNSSLTDATIHFMSSGHTFSEWIVDTEATCETAGTKHRACSSCGETETGIIPATGHDYSTEWTIDAAPTCIENGSKSHHCLNCDAKTDVTEILANGHTVGEWVVTTEPTCSTEGEKTGYCGACGTECANEVVPATEHNFDESKYEYVQNPDNTEEFLKKYECTDCGSTKFDEEPVILKSLVIESLPDNTTYIEGQEIDTTGLVVKAEFEDGTTAYISDYEISYDNSVAGEQQVTISCGDATATFTVTFKAKTLVSIAVTKMPDKTTYIVGESFDNTGMVVTATYDNGLTADVTDYTISGFSSTKAGTKTVVITYSGKRVSIKVTVEEAPEKVPVSMNIINEPDKFEYVSGEEFDPTGMIVEITFSDGTVEKVTDYEIEGFGDFYGYGDVIVKYGDLTGTILVGMHNTENGVSETSATCTENGVKEYYCEECDDIVKTEILPATGHNPSTEWTIDVQPTCTENGSKSHHCLNCDDKTDVTEIIATGHNYGDLVVEREPTCSNYGYGYRICTNYSYNTAREHCEYRKDEVIPATGHSYSDEWTIDVAPTCTENGSKSHHCLNCDDKTDVTEIIATGHTASDWIVDEEATCTASGSKHTECIICGETLETAEIPVTGHSYSTEWIIDKAASCTEAGSKSRHCLNCDSIADVTEIAATGHSYGDWVIDDVAGTQTRECIICGNTVTEEIPTDSILTFTLSDDGTYYILSACKTTAEGIIEIPATYKGLPVKVIGAKAFYYCEQITGIVIPDSIEIIEEKAFYSCSKLLASDIPGSVTNIGDYAFSKCASITEVIIPEGVVSIGNGAFEYCDSLTSITVSDSVISISEYAFAENDSLEYVEFGKNVTSIGLGCFCGCPVLKFVDIPYGVTVIEEGLFNECFSLESVTIPDTVVSIETEAFVNCWSLTAVVIPDSVTSLADSVFGRCSSLEYIELPEGITELGDNTFRECRILKSVVIKGELTSIGEYSFYACNQLKYIFYAHSESDWNKIAIATNNSDLDTAIIHYNSTDHTYEWNITEEATCTDYGTKVEKCTYCDLQGSVDVIPATGHSYGDWVVDSEATCVNEGSRHRTCAACQATETDAIAAVGHKYLTEWIIEKDATCESDGERYRQCYSCDSKITETIAALGHDYSNEFTVDVEATCQQNGLKSRHCSRCDSKTDSTVIEMTGHNYADWVVTIPATCEEDGERARICVYCDDTITETVAAPGHVYSNRWTTDKTPTCTVAGSKSHHCNRPGCDSRIDVTEIAPSGHSFGEWEILENPTCTINGERLRMCNTCYVEELEVIKAPGHSYGEWVVESVADCTTDGKRHATCGTCGFVNNETVKAYGHDYETVFTVDKEATCTEAGSKSRHCSRCESKADETVIAALGHHVSTMWTIDTEPTCESEGSKSHHCLRCDAVSDVTVIPVASHIYGKWEVVTPATMDTAGVRAHKCYNCEMTEEAELPKLLKYTATFVADGDIVAAVDFPEDATEFEIPEVPHKDKFNGEWENFDVRNKNFTVNAVYTPIPTEQIDGITAGNTADYYSSTGEVEINLNVSAPGKTIVTTTTKAVPLDIVFVLDQSGSMEDGGKKTALKNAVSSFSNAILDDAIANSVDHRIAVVGFASGSNNNPGYQNTELLTAGVVKYNKITNEDYKNALVSVNDNGALNEVITDAVKAIDAEGATRADIGLEMASNIFANNPVTDNRQRVVVFLTDGVPTSYSGFEYSVANVAIQNAYQLKNRYDATVYSVGVFDRDISANRSVNNFMNYISSNYNEEVVMTKYSNETTENTSGYYLDVSDVDSLSEVFSSIVEETTTHTGRFTNATLKYTLTKYFTLTSVQEAAIRSSAVENLGVTNEQVSINRNSDGTTTIVISGVEPWADGEKFVIDFTFRVTANEKTLKSGTYQVGTFESGVILENGEGYEAVFTPNTVDIGGTSGIAVFNINSLPYAINRLSSTTKVVAPATDFGADYNFVGWNVPENLILNNEVRVFDAELLKNEYKISWNIDGEITEVKYAVGDFITVPEVSNNSIGGAFVGWDKEIPETMLSENLTITAIYDAHYHKYGVTKDFKNCTEGGTLTYTCECGDTYTEEIESCEHSWEVITASNNQNAIENAGSRCAVCGIKDSKALRLEGKDTHQTPDASYNTATYELDYIDENGDKHQPEGEIEISVQLDEVFDGDIPQDANASVYRVNDDGSRTKLPSEQNGMRMKFTTDHFSTYQFEFTTGEQRYLFAEKGSEIDYVNKLIFSNTYLAKGFNSLVTYLLPATIKAHANDYGHFGTGTSIDLSKDGTTDSYKVIINGDLNGDGVCDVLDAAQAQLVSSSKEVATQEEIYAANGCVSDEIDATSYQNVVNMALAS